MSVDTYLQGKNLDPYTVVSDGEVEVLLSPHLVRWASEVNLDVKKRLVGKKLIAIARLDNQPDVAVAPPAVASSAGAGAGADRAAEARPPEADVDHGVDEEVGASREESPDD